MNCAGCGERFGIGVRVPWEGEHFHSQCLNDYMSGNMVGSTRRRMSEFLDRARSGSLAADDVAAILALLLQEAMQR